MKLNNLNLGKSLSRAEMKQVKGGTKQCALGNYVPDCKCTGSTETVCIPANGNTPGADCILYCSSIGYVSGIAMTCAASC